MNSNKRNNTKQLRTIQPIMVSKVNTSTININADIKSQQDGDNVSKKNKKNNYKNIDNINNNADIKSHQRIDNKVCIVTLDGHEVINNTNAHNINHINRAQSHNKSDNTIIESRSMSDNIASEFSIDIMIDETQERFTKQAYVKLENIIEENAQGISDHTLHIKSCWKIHYIKSNDNIDLIEQKYYNQNWFIETDNIEQKYYTKKLSRRLRHLRPRYYNKNGHIKMDINTSEIDIDILDFGDVALYRILPSTLASATTSHFAFACSALPPISCGVNR